MLENKTSKSALLKQWNKIESNLILDISFIAFLHWLDIKTNPIWFVISNLSKIEKDMEFKQSNLMRGDNQGWHCCTSARRRTLFFFSGRTKIKFTFMRPNGRTSIFTPCMKYSMQNHWWYSVCVATKHRWLLTGIGCAIRSQNSLHFMFNSSLFSSQFFWLFV